MSLYLFFFSAPGGTSAIVTRLEGIDWGGEREREKGAMVGGHDSVLFQPPRDRANLPVFAKLKGSLNGSNVNSVVSSTAH